MLVKSEKKELALIFSEESMDVFIIGVGDGMGEFEVVSSTD